MADIIGMNITTWPPPPSEVLRELSPISGLVRAALDEASDEAVKLFEKKKWTIDPWFHSHQVRLYTKKKLIADGLPEMGYELADLAMSGLLIANGGIWMRILKAGHDYDDEGQRLRIVPVSNRSRARCEYYRQSSFDIDWAALGNQPPLKLVALWDVNRSYQLSALDLACTREFDLSRNCVTTYWIVPFPNADDEDIGWATEGTPGPLRPMEDLALRPRKTGATADGDIR